MAITQKGFYFKGLSTDVKPTTGISVDDLFLETDTGWEFVWTGAAWIESGGQNYAEMYKHESAVVTTIQDQNDWHLLNGFEAGDVGADWAFHAGGQLAITAYANNGDGKTQVTCALHGMTNGDAMSISGTVNYDGVWVVEQVTPNTFVIPIAFAGDDGASVGEHGSHFVAIDVAATGKYRVTYSLTMQPAGVNDVVETTIFLGSTQCIKCETNSKLGAVTDFQVVACSALLDAVIGTLMSIAIRNLSAGDNVLIRNANVTITRVGR